MIKQSQSYLRITPRYEDFYEVGNGLIENKPALIISRDPLKDTPYKDMKTVQYLWVSHIDEEKLKHYDPNNVEEIFYEIEHFVKKNQGGVILFAAIEYLISFNSFKEIFHLVQDVKDLVAVHNCSLVINIGINTLDQKEENLLKQELELL